MHYEDLPFHEMQGDIFIEREGGEGRDSEFAHDTYIHHEACISEHSSCHLSRMSSLGPHSAPPMIRVKQSMEQL